MSKHLFAREIKLFASNNCLWYIKRYNSFQMVCETFSSSEMDKTASVREKKSNESKIISSPNELI